MTRNTKDTEKQDVPLILCAFLFFFLFAFALNLFYSSSVLTSPSG